MERRVGLWLVVGAVSVAACGGAAGPEGDTAVSVTTPPVSVTSPPVSEAGIGSNSEVEVILEESFEGFVSGTGRMVANLVGPGGPVDVFFFERADSTLLLFCVAWGSSGLPPKNSECGTALLDPRNATFVGFEVHGAAESGSGLVLVPPDVTDVVLVFEDETQVSVNPVSGVAYAVWDSGGIPQYVEVIRANGTSERVRPFT